MVRHDRVVDDATSAHLWCSRICLREAAPERSVHTAGAKAGDAVPEAERHVHGEARGEVRASEVRDSGARAVRLPAGTLSPPAPLPEGQAGLKLLRLRHLELAFFYHFANLLSSIAKGIVRAIDGQLTWIQAAGILHASPSASTQALSGRWRSVHDDGIAAQRESATRRRMFSSVWWLRPTDLDETLLFSSRPGDSDAARRRAAHSGLLSKRASRFATNASRASCESGEV
jgi:hypothetical protein